jgi:hypothetical protein
MYGSIRHKDGEPSPKDRRIGRDVAPCSNARSLQDVLSPSRAARDAHTMREAQRVNFGQKNLNLFLFVCEQLGNPLEVMIH